MLKSTISIRHKLFYLFHERGNEFVSNKQCQNDEEVARLWGRYLIANNFIVDYKSKKGHIKINDPICNYRSILIPRELAEKILFLNYVPPIPAVTKTVADLSMRAIVREYRVKNFNISVYESITKENLLLFHNQYNFEDYNERAIKRASFVLPLSSEIIKIEKNEVVTKSATLIFSEAL